MTIQHAIDLYNAGLIGADELETEVHHINKGSDSRFYVIGYDAHGKAYVVR